MSQTSITITSELFAPAESSSFEGVYDLPLFKAGVDFYEFAEPLRWNLNASNTGDALLLVGTIEGVAKTACARCTEPFEFPITGDIEGYYLLTGDSLAPEDLDDDEFDVLPENNIIDLAPLFTAALLLEVPLLPLCDEGCAGLCPICGQNKNNEPCSCDEDAQNNQDSEKPHPFSALKDYPF
ncbi:MAG: DUF177 domain-containing protein [Eggerthellaceae bacterium]|nr:DUF177 domain-containing protein [Eggerthellaceae bacterium]